ncbi:THAP domain-containing 1-like, partial [Paramuricea clavata]
SNEPNLEKGIVRHCIPFADDERQEARKRRKKWIDFVQRKRLKWTPVTTSSICSQYFKDDFQRKFFVLASEEKTMKYMPRMKRDEIRVSVCPSVHLSSSTKPEETERDIRRKMPADIETAPITMKEAWTQTQSLPTYTSATIGCESETQKCDTPSTTAIPYVSSIPVYSSIPDYSSVQDDHYMSSKKSVGEDSSQGWYKLL